MKPQSTTVRNTGADENAAGAERPAGSRPVRIICDDRERSSGVVDELRKLPATDVVVRRLLAGDYLIDGRVLVERKTVHDFAVSIMDGRLFQQATRLVRTMPGRVVVLLEGDRSVLSEPGLRRESVQGALVTLSVVLGIPVLRAKDAAETARILRYTTEQLRRAGANTIRRAGYRPRRLRARQLFILQGLPGVGPERAARLLDACGSVAGVFAADEKALAQIRGIGQHTAAAIHLLMHAGTGVQPGGNHLPESCDLDAGN
ncbi:MAG: ERCC4 domain-containing protein [bacterium]